MDDKSVEFSKKVAQAASRYCKGIGLTHKEIADSVGISKSQVDNWFSHGNFSAKGIAVLTHDFGVPKEIFTTGEYKPKNITMEQLVDRLMDQELRLTKLELAVRTLIDN